MKMTWWFIARAAAKRVQWVLMSSDGINTDTDPGPDDAWLCLVRHGETVGESAIRLYGRTDIELSESGREQMRRTGRALREVDFDMVVVSPLRRSREGADIIMNARGPAPVVEPEFTEIDFGNWEGWSLAEAAERDPDAEHARQTRGADFRFPGGESKREFFSRTGAAAARVFGGAQGRILAVLHKGVIKGVLAGLLNRPVEDFVSHRIELGGIHILERRGGRWRLLADNDTAHLGDARIPESG